MKITEYVWGVQTFPRDIVEAQQRVFRALSGDLPTQVADSLGQLKTEPADPSKPEDYFLMVNRHRDHHFRIEIKREFVGYAHQTNDPEDMRDHVVEFSPQLLGALFTFDRKASDDSRVDLSHGIRRVSYKFSTKLDCRGSGRLKNREGLCKHLVTGLQAKALPQLGLPGDLARVDLSFCLNQQNVTLGDRAADLELWIDLQTPSDGDYQYLEVAFVLQTAESRMSKPWEATLWEHAYDYVRKMANSLLEKLY